MRGEWQFLSRSPESPPQGRGTNEVSQCRNAGSRSRRGVRRCSEAKGRSPASLPSPGVAVPPPPRFGRRPAPASPGKSPPPPLTSPPIVPLAHLPLIKLQVNPGAPGAAPSPLGRFYRSELAPSVQDPASSPGRTGLARRSHRDAWLTLSRRDRRTRRKRGAEARRGTELALPRPLGSGGAENLSARLSPRERNRSKALRCPHCAARALEGDRDFGERGDLETHAEWERARGRGVTDAEACHFASAGSRRGRAGRAPGGRPAGVRARRPPAAGEAREQRGGRGGRAGPGGGRPLRAARLGPGAVCCGPRGLVRGCMPPHASGRAPPGRNSAPGSRGRQEGERAGAGRAAWGWAGGDWECSEGSW